MSRKANTCSDSKSLKEGMSPIRFVLLVCTFWVMGGWIESTFDDLAEYTSCSHVGRVSIGLWLKEWYVLESMGE